MNVSSNARKNLHVRLTTNNSFALNNGEIMLIRENRITHFMILYLLYNRLIEDVYLGC